MVQSQPGLEEWLKGNAQSSSPSTAKKKKKNKKKHISTKNFLKAHVYLRKVYVKFY
jgi:hypothetical protein